MKGGSFEREIAKYLTKWLTGKEKPYVYWRTPSSGGMATISEANKEISGDIIALRIEGAFLTDRFSVELKTGYPKASFHQHLKDNKNFEIENFWKQCLRDAERASKYPMLMYRKLGFPIILGIDEDIREKILYHIQLPKRIVLCFETETPDVNFYDMESFFKLVTPEIIKKI
jgi:hypothetical protein